MKVALFAVLISLSAFIVGCSKDKAFQVVKSSDDSYICDPGTISYQRDVIPILKVVCVICHPNFLPYANISGSIEMGSFAYRTFDLKDMPPTNTLGPKALTKEELEIIKCWVESGYPNN